MDHLSMCFSTIFRFPCWFCYTVSSVEVVGDWGWPFMSMAKRWHRSSRTPFSKALLQVVNLLLAKSGQLGPQNLHELPGKSLVDWFCRFNGLPSKYLNKYLMWNSSLWCWLSGGPLAPSGLTRSFWRLLLQCKSPGRLGAKPHKSKIMAPAAVFHLQTDPFVGEFQALALGQPPVYAV
jgi:hypothetical protein